MTPEGNSRDEQGSRNKHWRKQRKETSLGKGEGVKGEGNNPEKMTFDINGRVVSRPLFSIRMATA